MSLATTLVRVLVAGLVALLMVAISKAEASA
jgi:hypothetical protein